MTATFRTRSTIETVRVPLADGIASWQNDEADHSVVVNGENADVQVRLQTGL